MRNLSVLQGFLGTGFDWNVRFGQRMSILSARIQALIRNRPPYLFGISYVDRIGAIPAVAAYNHELGLVALGRPARSVDKGYQYR